MKIKELLETTEEAKYDVVDDLLFFMRNDNRFYRHHYFPAISKLSDFFKKNKKIKKSIITKLVDSAIPIYCKTYKILEDPKKMFTKEITHSIINKIISDEKNDIVSKNT